MITRVRVEGKGEDEEAVREELVNVAADIRDDLGGQWTEESEPQMMTVRDGYWGRYAIKRDT